MNRVAVIHEWLTTYAGSERVVEQMLNMFPESDLFAVADFLSDEDRAFLSGKEVTTSFVQRLPFAKRFLRHYLPFMPTAVEQWDLAEYDVVLSSNHAVAKGVITGPDQLHVSYVHTPIRYAWEFQAQYLRESNLSWGLRSMMIRSMLHYIRNWDHASASRVDHFVANSNFIARRIEKCYRRTADVVYPPVDIDAFPACYEKSDYYIAASRLVPYKRVDLIVEAFRKMPDRKLLVVGDGPMHKQLSATCPGNVELLGYRPHSELVSLMQNAKAFVFAAEEDFGIMPVEAQACATPVIAYGRGGSLETVQEGATGYFFREQSPESLVEAVEEFERPTKGLDLGYIRQRSEYFRPERFKEELSQAIDKAWDSFQAGRLHGNGHFETSDANKSILNHASSGAVAI